MSPLRVAIVFGTRPEAIKLCALVRRLQCSPETFEVRTCVTAQHRLMLDQVLRTFQIKPDYDLDLMRPEQTLSETVSRLLAALEPLLAAERPDLLLVQGDTTTALAGALAAFYRQVPVAHVEAGLRTGSKACPFPEEMNRRLITGLSELHFAATQQAAANLCREGVAAERIFVTGNTVIDALLYTRAALLSGRIPTPLWPFRDSGRKLVIVTSHRRESFGEAFERICHALARLSVREDVEVVYPLHPNPDIDRPARRILGTLPGIRLLEPLAYTSFVDLMMRSHLILTDSGGVQEEAPALGKPVLVLREDTERREAVLAGTARVVGTDPETIVREATRLLDDPEHYERMARRHNPYGDGHACERIARVLAQYSMYASPSTELASIGPRQTLRRSGHPPLSVGQRQG